MLSKHQKRKLWRYGKTPGGLDGIALYFIEKKEAEQKRYKKPRHSEISQKDRESMIMIESKNMLQA